MADFKKLLVWQKAHKLLLDVHRVAPSLRGRGLLDYRTQLVRAARSISANIVEGRGRNGSRQFAHFIDMSISSADEVEQHLIEGHDTQVLREADYVRLRMQLVEIRKMLHGLQRRLREDIARAEEAERTRKEARRRPPRR